MAQSICYDKQSANRRVGLMMSLVLVMILMFAGGFNLHLTAAQGSPIFCRQSLVFGDFDGNGFDDLAIGCHTTNASIAGAGAVYVFYSDVSGLAFAGGEVWHLNSQGIEGVAEADDDFGRALAVGDFNDDGVDDLAIGAPGIWLLNGVKPEGQVNIIFGSLNNGLTSLDNRLYFLSTTAVTSGRFGEALAVGDFDADGLDDLAVGAPDSGATIVNDNAKKAYGIVEVIYGNGDRDIWDQNSINVKGNAEEGDRFGSSLATGDFDGNGADDLAIGIPNETFEGFFYNDDHAGAVNVLYGIPSVGLQSEKNQMWHQDSNGIHGEVEQDDWFGFSLAAGDFNNDGADDLAIGVPRESFARFFLDEVGVGMVNVIYGKQLVGLDQEFNQSWHQNTAGVEGSSEDFDNFGRSLAAGDFNGDGSDDLAIGVIFESIDGIKEAGAINIIYGGNPGLGSQNNLMVHQGTFGVQGELEDKDLFAQALAVGRAGLPANPNSVDRYVDLAIGVNDGQFCAANILYGSGNGIMSEGNQQLLCQNLSIFEQLLEVSNGTSSSFINVDGNYGNSGPGSEWSDVLPSAFIIDTQLVTNTPINPNTNSLIFAATSPDVTTKVVEDLYMLFDLLPRTNPVFEAGQLIAAISFPVQVPNGNTNSQTITAQIFSTESDAVTLSDSNEFGVDILVDLDADGISDIPASELGIEVAVRIGPSSLSEVHHLQIELKVPLYVPVGFSDPPGLMSEDSPTGLYPPGPAFWRVEIATDPGPKEQEAPPILVSTILLRVDPDASVVTLSNLKVDRLVNIDVSPKSKSNEIDIRHTNSDDLVEVAIMTTTGFDATEVDPSTVELASPADLFRSVHNEFSNIEDVDQDGDLDIILSFDTNDLLARGVLSENSNSVALFGKTTSDESIASTDVVGIIEEDPSRFISGSFSFLLIVLFLVLLVFMLIRRPVCFAKQTSG